MAGYDFLAGIRVLEVAQLGPSSLGGYLADMGAEVVKVEGLDGDPLRHSSSPAVGSPDGPSFLHLRWNRGKKSLGLDLKTDDGRALFRRLAARADVVIEGMRAGVLERLGLGDERLRADHPRLVFCSLSGLGGDGPYHTLGSHGPSFDAFGALSSLNPYALEPHEREGRHPVGMHAMGLYAALGVLSAVVRAQRSGRGARIEVSGAESAAHWLPEGVNVELNAGLLHERPGFANGAGKMAGWSRLCAYATQDGGKVFFQGLSAKFWKRFCTAIGRDDLLDLGAGDTAATDDAIHRELSAIFATRPRAAWMQLFIEHDVPGGPANTRAELARDPHFLARGNLYETEHPGIGVVRLTGTPVKTPGQAFAPTAAPAQFQHSDDVLRDWLGLDARATQPLRDGGTLLGPREPDPRR
ncbi:CaiB/BaiF CoA transferase family protein [Solimonas soli]|uniref:CaiB/BaiF CoA transferase family protein n=1 Tax=Solimonas soli TaxID=413479 RepID=UPI0004BCC5C2|nr:CoA transferase [Solimonas soli]